MKQHTLKAPFSFEGKGLHTGLFIHANFLPAEENTGVRICRTDLEGRPIIPLKFLPPRQKAPWASYR